MSENINIDDSPEYTLEEIASGLPQHDSLLERAKTVGEGVLQGALGPVGTATAIGFGSDPEMMRERAQAHPIAHGASELGGFLGSVGLGAGVAPIIGKAGAAVGAASGLGKIGAGAVGLGAEMGLLSAGDEVSKLIMNDPEQSIGSAASHVGASALLGLGGGAALGGLGKLWDVTAGSKVNQFIEDFKGRIDHHISNPDPLEAITKELQDHHNAVLGMADEVYGPSGLKAQDISKAVPAEMTTKIADQASSLHSEIGKIIEKAKTEPAIYGGQKLNALEEYHARLTKALSSEGSDNTVNVYNILNDFKKDIGPLKDWKAFHPSTEKPISKLIGDVYGKVQGALEDVDVWGKAAERQQSINKAFTEFLPSLKDFQKTFTTNVGGEYVVDPSKVQTYLNGLGKSTAEIKQAKLENFLDASEKYKNVVDASHRNLGLDAPEWTNSLNASKATLNEVSDGARLADALVKKGMAKFGGRALGAGIGAGLGRLVGSRTLGALIGEHTLGPLFESVLPALTKPILKNMNNPEGLKAAIDYGMAVAKGEKVLKQAVGNIFKKEGGTIIPFPSDKTIEKLEHSLKAAQNDPSVLLNSGTQVAHYLPDHAAAIAGSALGLVSVLNGMRPNTSPQGPLEDDRIPDKMEDARYTKALMLAEQPALILNKVKDGTITQGEMQLVNQLHPGFIRNVQQKIVAAVADQVGNGEIIPYKTRMGLSTILSQPLDASLKGLNIASNQVLGSAQKGGQPQGKSDTGQQKTALQKLSGMYNTPIQARDQEKTKVS